jgi:hypothetical protein
MDTAGIASEPEAIGILACILRLGVSSTSFRVRQMLAAASTRSTFRRSATHSTDTLAAFRVARQGLSLV